MYNINNKIEKAVYSIPEVAQILGISRSLCYTLAANGEIPVIRLGARRVVVAKAALEKMLNDEVNQICRNSVAQ